MMVPPTDTWIDWPKAVPLQWIDVSTPYRIARRLVCGPDGAPLELSFADAVAYAASVGASLPRWYGWEIAVRGPEPWLWPWGDTLDLGALTWRRDGEVAFIETFGAYAGCTSIFGVGDLARAGGEWNVCHAGAPTKDDDHLVRSLSDVGAMLYWMPGVRRTFLVDEPSGPRERLFSGPLPSAYGLEHGAYTVWGPDRQTAHLWPKAAFRLVIREPRRPRA
jgi:hypothetical protein